MIFSKLRGHDIYLSNKVYVYRDNGDPCLGTLPGLMNACCGHGNVTETYVQFLDGQTIRGEDARTIIEILKRWRDNET